MFGLAKPRDADWLAVRRSAWGGRVGMPRADGGGPRGNGPGAGGIMDGGWLTRLAVDCLRDRSGNP
ncbi:hypothetical protein CCR87_14775 [Rhodobaculum claviforme]|uniref:Uncharacterized protein n=1 Tax=Rhodobaculum claviforme TaxID=1549854 RepID=A0A934TLZ2_9RHOB|nr:hypothetical protein [Rhodobaculum claviforme]